MVGGAVVWAHGLGPSREEGRALGPGSTSGRRAERAHLVGVPQANGAAEGHLPHQQVVHPAEGELQVPHLVLLQVPVDLLCMKQTQAPGVR